MFFIIFIIATAFLSIPLYSEEKDSSEELKMLIHELEKKQEEQNAHIQELEKKVYEKECEEELEKCEPIPEGHPALAHIWLVPPYTDEVTLFIGGFLQFDGRFFTNTEAGPSTFLIRRARFLMLGTWERLFGYEAEFQWDNNNNDFNLNRFYIETLRPSFFQVRAGLFKEPFSMEILYHDYLHTFNELSLGSINFLQREDLGVMVFGNIGCLFDYYLGIFNGRGKLFDNNNNKEIVGRVVFSPWLLTDTYIKFLYIGLSGSNERQTEILTDLGFLTGARTEFWTWEGSPFSFVAVNDTRNRWGGDFEWFLGSLVLRGEYLNVDWGNVYREGLNVPFHAQSGFVECAYLITGECEPRNYPIIPRRYFNFCGGPGAWELAARYEVLHINPAALHAGFARGANHVSGPTLAVHWYFNPYVCLKSEWQLLHFNRRVEVRDRFIRKESVITVRLQGVF